jgi:hypothetical protein
MKCTQGQMVINSLYFHLMQWMQRMYQEEGERWENYSSKYSNWDHQVQEEWEN